MSVILTLLIFTVIVVIHEGGHFWVAKKCNVLVEEFSVGMGPKLWGFKKGDTDYNIRILPLGGFCRMAEEVEGRDDVISFNDTTPLQRIAICFAGPLMNFVLAFIAMTVIAMCTYMMTTNITAINENSAAAEAGIQVGDTITAVDGHRVYSRNDFNFYTSQSTDDNYVLTVKRNGRNMDFDISPRYDDNEKRSLFGFSLDIKAPYFDVMGLNEDNLLEKGSLLEYFSYGFFSMISIVKMTAYAFVQLITSKIAITEMSGPIGITSAVGEVYRETVAVSKWAVILSMLNLTALLSANLGVINLFPLPAIDGGRIVIALIEFITRKTVPKNIEAIIHFIGFVLLMALAVYIAFNDVLKLI